MYNIYLKRRWSLFPVMICISLKYATNPLSICKAANKMLIIGLEREIYENEYFSEKFFKHHVWCTYKNSYINYFGQIYIKIVNGSYGMYICTNNLKLLKLLSDYVLNTDFFLIYCTVFIIRFSNISLSRYTILFIISQVYVNYH